ncbi:hypothetical protein CMQ_4948 [Grosmannia clavigera kw1407]|uniref:Uncharacterized protein n=1 Tax=Grosmannia clavigera (strain kw1407 / UAMH 11150) TaxID=655863 RepID=F0XKB2_GROCL|nr:uncharacterized protein CMQ_4948 [Grosmannia clavigera kw1407]EFX01877.1 hypothetical protein CMQ_4948 [Grosmannia clavigera kw1407]
MRTEPETDFQSEYPAAIEDIVSVVDQHYDSSAKSTEQNLYLPIHKLNTLDVFATSNLGDLTGSSGAVRNLFSYGRPL